MRELYTGMLSALLSIGDFLPLTPAASSESFILLSSNNSAIVKKIENPQSLAALGISWSYYPDLNRGPHPCQLT